MTTITTTTVDPPVSADMALFLVSARFPQGAGNFVHPASAAAPSTDGARPFGLRFARPRVAPAAALAQLPSWEYSHDRQIALVAGTGESWAIHAAGTGSMDTTGPSTDGSGSTGGEEWTPDFVGDMAP